MPDLMTPSQLNMLNEYAAAGDRIAYYKSLASCGYSERGVTH